MSFEDVNGLALTLFCIVFKELDLDQLSEMDISIVMGSDEEFLILEDKEVSDEVVFD